MWTGIAGITKGDSPHAAWRCANQLGLVTQESDEYRLRYGKAGIAGWGALALVESNDCIESAGVTELRYPL